MLNKKATAKTLRLSNRGFVGNGSSTNPGAAAQSASSAQPVEATETPDQINARLLREQWADWENRFQPFQDMAFASITDPAEQARLDQEALTNSGAEVDASFDRLSERIQTLNSRLPTQTDPQVEASRERQLSLARRASKVDAYNQTQVALGDRELRRLTG